MTGSVRRILVLNVGKPTDGDIAQRPEAFALREAKPDFVVFVCSHPAELQPGSLEFVHQYAALAGLPPDRYEVLALADPDDLVRCYEALVVRFAELRQRFPGAELVADYTAGTKSMSAALVLAALDAEAEPLVQLRLVRGARGRQATVIPGTEHFAPVSDIHDVRARRFVALARAALDRFDYAEAAEALGQALQQGVSPDLRRRLERTQHLCRAFDAWDRYELENARQLLDLYRREWHRALTVLHELHGVVQAFARDANRTDEPARLTGLDELHDPYIAVEDVLLNAERRAEQQRYDDAMARVYRALELLVQLRLWLGHHLDTGAIALDRLPEQLRSEYASRADRDRPLTLALVPAWD
ncbi:MAG: TIGR02710 family CRISPR-associated CARF protein, partial [Thermomicrobium sp.]|nr:TIGR02710 family CRISPR-associated CARF protein [Thermomicrobium sp.]